jgi:hypothetical protein
VLAREEEAWMFWNWLLKDSSILLTGVISLIVGYVLRFFGVFTVDQVLSYITWDEGRAKGM